MISTEFNGETVFVLDDEWDGTDVFNLDGSIIRDEQVGLTKRSARRPYSKTLVCRCQYRVTLQDAELRAVIGCLRAMTTEKAILPLWPALAYWADRAEGHVSGGLRIVFKRDWSQFAIYAAGDDEPGWPSDGDLFAPALMGFINPTQPKMLSPDAATWSIDFNESSPADYALSFNGDAAAAGPQPAGYAAAPKVLPLQPNFQEVDEEISVDVKREQIGFGREQNETFYPHAAMRTQRASYTLKDDDSWAMLKFFVDVMGPGASFWASTWLQCAKLTADVAADDTVLHVLDTKAVNVGDYVSLYDGEILPRKITAKTDDTLTINAAPGSDLSLRNTCLFQLCLARLNQSSISIAWRRPGAAKCDLLWQEQPPEYIIPADETLAATIGGLPVRVVLLQFFRDLGNGTVVNYYFTPFEKDITGLEKTWLSQGKDAWGVGEISQSLNLEEDTLQIDSFIFDGNPLNDDTALRAEAPLNVIIRYADYDGVDLTNVQIVFSGDAAAPSRQGNKLTINCKLGGSIFETQLPRMVRGVMCNFLGGSNNDGSFLISAGCTLLKADWKFTALVTGPVSIDFPFTLNLGTLTGVGAKAVAALAGDAVFENWFPPGWIEWGAGAAIQRRCITSSTAIVASALSVNLHRYFSSLPAIGDTITLYPGCNGLAATCRAFNGGSNPTGKFDNYVNFGGEPFTPIANPSTSGQPNLGAQGGKK